MFHLSICFQDKDSKEPSVRHHISTVMMKKKEQNIQMVKLENEVQCHN